MNEIYGGITMNDEKRQIIFKNLYKESLEENERDLIKYKMKMM